MMPQRRWMLMAAAQNKRFWLYKNGVTAEGYSFIGAGNYGGTSSGTFTNTDGQLKCYVYDGTASAFGYAMVESTGLSRNLLSQYKKICFNAMCSPDYPSSVQYQHVGIYSGATPTTAAGLAVVTPSYDAYGKVTIDIATLLANNPDVNMFYIGAGVLTVASMAYGAVYVSIKEIWLE